MFLEICWGGGRAFRIGIGTPPPACPAASVGGAASFGELRAGLAVGARRRELRVGLACVRTWIGEESRA